MQIDLTTAPKPSPAPPSDPPTVPLVKPPTPTAAELAKQEKEMRIAMGWDKPEGEPTPPAPLAPPVVPSVVPAPEPVREPIAEPTTEQIIQRTVAATVSALPTPSAPVAPAPVAPTFDMLPDDAETHKVLLYLETSAPEKFKGKAGEFLAYVKKHYAYQDQWQAENPGKPFEPDDTEHQGWYDQNYPEIKAKDVEDGRISMLVDEAAERKYREKIQPIEDAKKEEEDQRKADEAWEKAIPVATRNVQTQVIRMVEASRPELAQMLRDANGAPNLSDQAITMVDAADPIAKEIFDELSQERLIPLLTECEKVATPGLNYKLDPENNRLHAAIDRYRVEAEADIQKLPADQQQRDGRSFITIPELDRLKGQIINGTGTAEEKQRKITDLRVRYWNLTIDDLEIVITDDIARLAQKKIEKRDTSARRKYANGQPPEPVTPSSLPQPIPAPTAIPTPGKPRPPSLSTGSDVVTTGNPGQPAPKSWSEEAAAVHFK